MEKTLANRFRACYSDYQRGKRCPIEHGGHDMSKFERDRRFYNRVCVAAAIYLIAIVVLFFTALMM